MKLIKIFCGSMITVTFFVSLIILYCNRQNIFDNVGGVESLTTNELKPGFSMGFVSRNLWYYAKTNATFEIGTSISVSVQEECVLIVCCVDATTDVGCNFLIEDDVCKRCIIREPH